MQSYGKQSLARTRLEVNPKSSSLPKSSPKTIGECWSNYLFSPSSASCRNSISDSIAKYPRTCGEALARQLLERPKASNTTYFLPQKLRDLAAFNPKFLDRFWTTLGPKACDTLRNFLNDPDATKIIESSIDHLGHKRFGAILAEGWEGTEKQVKALGESFAGELLSLRTLREDAMRIIQHRYTLGEGNFTSGAELEIFNSNNIKEEARSPATFGSAEITARLRATQERMRRCKSLLPDDMNWNLHLNSGATQKHLLGIDRAPEIFFPIIHTISYANNPIGRNIYALSNMLSVDDGIDSWRVKVRNSRVQNVLPGVELRARIENKLPSIGLATDPSYWGTVLEYTNYSMTLLSSERNAPGILRRHYHNIRDLYRSGGIPIEGFPTTPDTLYHDLSVFKNLQRRLGTINANARLLDVRPRLKAYLESVFP